MIWEEVSLFIELVYKVIFDKGLINLLLRKILFKFYLKFEFEIVL